MRRLEEIESLKEELGRKEAACKTACQDRDAMKTKLEKATRRNFEDCDFELLHLVETLKKECQTVLYSKQALERSNAKLAAEIDNMATLLADKEVELKNERLRHSLLMSQFNSLIQENSNLKDKNQVQTIPKQQSIPPVDNECMSDVDDIQIPPSTSGVSTVASRRTSAAPAILSLLRCMHETLNRKRQTYELARDLFLTKSKPEVPGWMEKPCAVEQYCHRAIEFRKLMSVANHM